MCLIGGPASAPAGQHAVRYPARLQAETLPLDSEIAPGGPGVPRAAGVGIEIGWLPRRGPFDDAHGRLRGPPMSAVMMKGEIAFYGNDPDKAASARNQNI